MLVAIPPPALWFVCVGLSRCMDVRRVVAAYDICGNIACGSLRVFAKTLFDGLDLLLVLERDDSGGDGRDRRDNAKNKVYSLHFAPNVKTSILDHYRTLMLCVSTDSCQWPQTAE